jgi:hypothetical protein
MQPFSSCNETFDDKDDNENRIIVLICVANGAVGINVVNFTDLFCDIFANSTQKTMNYVKHTTGLKQYVKQMFEHLFRF